MLDIKITNGKVFIPRDGFFDLDVGIKDGKVVLLSKSLTFEAATTLDAEQNIVMPGVIDPHIHLGIFNDFKLECETETKAALAGGITTVGVFMGGAESYLPTLQRMIDTANDTTFVDFFIHLSIFTPQQLNEMEKYYELFGVTSFKFYMAGVRGVFPGVTDGFILEGFKKVASMGEKATACVHCEDQSMLDIAFDKLVATKPNGNLADWAEAHPDIAEEEAIVRAYFLAEKTGAKLYIVHVSSKLGADRLYMLKKTGTAKVFGETTSAYLTVNKYGEFGLLGKMLPPLRDPKDSDALWERVVDHTIQSFGTDNVSMNLAIKGPEKGMLNAMPGYPILQTHLSAILTEGYHKRGISLENILTKATLNPAKIFGIYPQKGTIAVGSDADIVILDINKEWTVRSSELFTYGDFSLFEGKTLKGQPITVIKSGKLAFQNGNILISPGVGRYLKRSL